MIESWLVLMALLVPATIAFVGVLELRGPSGSVLPIRHLGGQRRSRGESSARPIMAIVIAAAILLALPAAEAGGSACTDGVVGGRLLAVSGRRFAALAGRPATELGAWAWRDGRRVPVPFQIDECDGDGRVMIGTHDLPAPSAALGPRSLVLLRREDAAERSPAGGASEHDFEIEVPDATGERRWLYLGPAHAELPPSVEDEVDYDPLQDRVHAARYTLGFDRPQVSYFSAADGKGRDRGNLLDRLKARVRARIFWGLIEFRRNEDQVTETVLGHGDGPLRAVRRARLEVEIGWGLPSPVIIADDYFYADHAEGPMSISVPFALSYVLGDLDVRIFLDFRDLDGFELFAEGLGAAGVPVGKEAQLPTPPPGRTTWFALRKGGMAFLHRIRLDAGLSSVRPTLYYTYAPDRPDPPEAVRGERPAVGYRLTDWSSVGRGHYEIWMDTYLLDGAMAQDPRAAVSSLSSVSSVTVRQLGVTPSAPVSSIARRRGPS